MGVFTIQYETDIKPKLEAAITDTLNDEVLTAAMDALKESAETRIYKAYATKGHRRFSATHDNSYLASTSGYTLTITYEAGFQGGDASGDLGDVIAGGDTAYHMPFPRPWMDEGILDNMDKIESALKSGLASRGF